MKRILFVDDEPRVLEGLRRMLYGMRNEWHMEFAPNGEEALKILQQREFEVVMTDMRMPGMDGAELLQHVAELHPHVIRIVLSGQSDEASILRCVGKSHLYLAKPCDAEMIKMIVTRACKLPDLLTQDKLKDVILQMESLPSLPAAYEELHAEIVSDEPSIQNVVEIVSKDVSLIARMLHLANSAYFGGNLDVTDFKEAVLKLGLKTIGELVLTANVFSHFDKALTKTLYTEEIMSHSLLVGRLAKALAEAEHLSQKAIGDSFSAGLIHDVGKLVLSSKLPQEYQQALESAKSENIRDVGAEYRIFGTTHAEVGAYLLGLWGLPDILVEAIAFHHSPNQAIRREIGPLAMVHAADVLEHELDHKYAPGVGNQFDLEYLEAVNLADHLPLWKETRDIVGIERQ
jgi:HD-like signal output (HDOD) protein